MPSGNVLDAIVYMYRISAAESLSNASSDWMLIPQCLHFLPWDMDDIKRINTASPYQLNFQVLLLESKHSSTGMPERAKTIQRKNKPSVKVSPLGEDRKI